MKSNPPQILAIFSAPSAGVPMVTLKEAELISGFGIKGDRYAEGIGAFSQNEPRKIRHLSLISEAGIEIANEWLEADHEPPFSLSETRRNIVLSNISPNDLNVLVGKIFCLGDVLCKGVELCTPCMRPAELAHKLNFMDAFAGRGGLRAEVLSDGIVKVGSALTLERSHLA